MLPYSEADDNDVDCLGVEHDSAGSHDEFTNYVQQDIAPVTRAELGGRAAIVVEGADGQRVVVADHEMTGAEVDAIRRAAPFLPTHDTGPPEV